MLPAEYQRARLVSREVGLSWRKAAYLRDLRERTLAGYLRAELDT